MHKLKPAMSEETGVEMTEEQLLRTAHNRWNQNKHCGRAAAQAYEMKYCRKCLLGILEAMDLREVEEFIGLRLPVIDDWGIVHRATLAVPLCELLMLLETEQEMIDLAGYAFLLQIEDMRQTTQAYH